MINVFAHTLLMSAYACFLIYRHTCVGCNFSKLKCLVDHRSRDSDFNGGIL